jgi:hypothetical protein
MFVFTVSANTTAENFTFSCHLLHVSAIFGLRYVDFTTYMEKSTDVQAFPSQLIY